VFLGIETADICCILAHEIVENTKAADVVKCHALHLGGWGLEWQANALANNVHE